jgi:hypothetical protein
MTSATYTEHRVPLCLTLTRPEQFTLYLRARELHEMVTDPTLDVTEMRAVRNDFLRAARTLAHHGFNFWRGESERRSR